MLTEQFDAEHEQLFTFKLGDGHEILMIRALVKARSRAIAELKTGQAGSTLEECRIHDSRFLKFLEDCWQGPRLDVEKSPYLLVLQHPVTTEYGDGRWHDIYIYDRSRLHEGLVVPGPAIIGEMDSTTVVLPGYDARVDAVGNLLINPVQGSN